MNSRPYSIAPGKSPSDGGFTLVELMITIAISGIVVAAIYSAYISQQRTYLAQEQVAEMQQNIRAAVYVMGREIRMVGYDPTQSAGSGITAGDVGRISFTQDINGNGTIDAGETIEFGFSAANQSLYRQTVVEPIAENIQAVEFRYLDNTGAVTATLPNVRAVQISLLARADNPDRNYTDTNVYTTAGGVNLGPFNDNFRRRFQIVTVQLRNMYMGL